MATYLVTGANRGIGLEYCKQLKNRGDDVIGTCRSCEKELFDLGVRVESDVDITSGESVLRLIKTLKGVKIDVLIQNAGILEANSFSNFDPESITRQFEVNALSPLCFTRAIINNLSCGSKVILMSSRMGSISDNSSLCCILFVLD